MVPAHFTCSKKRRIDDVSLAPGLEALVTQEPSTSHDLRKALPRSFGFESPDTRRLINQRKVRIALTTPKSSASSAESTSSLSRVENQRDTSLQCQRRVRSESQAVGLGKSPPPRVPSKSWRMLSRERLVRVAISEAVTNSSGSTRSTCRPRTALSTSAIAFVSA